MGKDVTAMGLEKKLTKHELKKHSATIHCSNTLSLLQRKISNALLYHAYHELMEKEEHEITIKQLCNLISYHGNNHAAIKDALKGLLSTVLEWNVVSDTTGVEDWTASSILASVSLKGPLCYFAYSPRMKQLLHSPSMFGKINLFIQSQFKSSYGLALYENCIRYRSLSFTKWFDMQTFRKLMGVPDDKYPIFRDFKRRVLDKSIEEVNTYSDLIIEAELARVGRKVTEIRFLLKERVKKARLGGSKALIDVQEIKNEKLESLKEKLMVQFGLSLEQAQEMISQYDVPFIQEKIEIIEASKNYQQGKVLNLAAYFLSSLKNNYQLPKTSKGEMEGRQKHHQQRQATLEELKRSMQKIKDSYSRYKEDKIDGCLNQLNQQEQEEIMQSFFEYAAEPIKTVLHLQKRKYTRSNVIQSPQIKALLRRYIVSEIPWILTEVLSLEEFISKLSARERKLWEQAKSERVLEETESEDVVTS